MFDVLARTETELTMRGVAELAGVSPQQASLVLRRLIELGVVERRDVPPVALVRLVRENLAAQAVVAVARLRQGAVERLRSLAVEIVPSPASLVVFGSFARGEAGVRSDVDVLAVRPPALQAATSTLGPTRSVVGRTGPLAPSATPSTWSRPPRKKSRTCSSRRPLRCGLTFPPKG